MSALLTVDKLTVRFGGLTAVSEVELDVEPGQVFAVIGPNGAGKTTVFNAIAGIYEPTEGSIRFEGKELARPLTRAHYAGWAFSGLLVGLFFLLFIANVDSIWAVSVKNNYLGKDQGGFQLASAFRDFLDYLAARPRIDRRLGRFQIASYDGQIQLGSAKALVEAQARREALEEMAELEGSEETIEPRGDRFAILSRDRSRLLDELPSRQQAVERVRAASTVAKGGTRARMLRLVAFLIGLVLGSAGGYAVWRQTRRAPAWISSQGIARTFQNIRLFQNMTVLENVLVGLDRHLEPKEPWYGRGRLVYAAAPLLLIVLLLVLALSLRGGWLSPGLAGALLIAILVGAIAYIVEVGRLGAFSRHALALHAGAVEEGRELLKFVGLEGKSDEVSKNLAYGNQRRLEIARALATKPKLLLLDEPAAGMNPAESHALTELVRSIRARGVTVLLIEHHMRVVMGISDRIAVLEYGRKIAEGTPEEIRANPRVIEAYLGKEEVG